MSHSKSSQTARVSRITRAVSGIQKYFASTASLVLAAATYTPAQLESLLQAYATAVTALQLLHAQLRTAVSGEKAQAAQVDALLAALEAYVVNMFGASSEQVTEFGFTPRKVTVLTAAEKAAATAKARATRKAKKDALASVAAGSTPAVTPAVSNGAPVVAAK
jgi:hypothetical protein